MSFDEFRRSIRTSSAPPPGLTPALAALWWDARGDWDKAHDAAQADSSADGAWVHAYLHRKEGDRGNAGYWYNRAGRPTAAATLALEDEWDEIAKDLIG